MHKTAQTRWGTNVLLFVSSYSPLALIVALRDVSSSPVWAKPTTWLQNPTGVVALLGLAVLSSAVCLLVIRSFHGGMPVDVIKSENRSNELVNYSLPYLVSFIGLDLGDFRAWGSFLIFFAVMFVMAVRTQSLFVNPVLVMFGYGLYWVEIEDHGRLRQELVLSPCPLTVGDRCSVMWLSPFLLLAISVSRTTQNGHQENTGRTQED